MNEGFSRTLSAVVGTFLLLVVGGVILVGGTPPGDPVIAGQVALLGLAGVVDIVAATDTQLTARVAWYRWSGLGNILLGMVLPLGFAESSDTLVFLFVTGVGGITLAAMGVDMLVFHGQYTRGERLDRDGT